jgi:MYXO-CTERM domain-containing protein
MTLPLDDGTNGSYWVGASDAVTPDSAAVSLGSYSSDAGAGVGVAHQVAYIAFPFEGVVGDATRTEVMRRLLEFLAPAGIDGGVMPNPDGGSPSVDGGSSSVDGGPSVIDGVSGDGTLVLPAGHTCGCQVDSGFAAGLAGLGVLLGLRRRRARRL